MQHHELLKQTELFFLVPESSASIKATGDVPETSVLRNDAGKVVRRSSD